VEAAYSAGPRPANWPLEAQEGIRLTLASIRPRISRTSRYRARRVATSARFLVSRCPAIRGLDRLATSTRSSPASVRSRSCSDCIYAQYRNPSGRSLGRAVCKRSSPGERDSWPHRSSNSRPRTGPAAAAMAWAGHSNVKMTLGLYTSVVSTTRCARPSGCGQRSARPLR
jgi:hypothetical protein